jgi:hypothetical protein
MRALYLALFSLIWESGSGSGLCSRATCSSKSCLVENVFVTFNRSHPPLIQMNPCGVRYYGLPNEIDIRAGNPKDRSPFLSHVIFTTNSFPASSESAAPPSNSTSHHHMISTPTVLYRPFWAANFGHYLYDDIFAAYFAVQHFLPGLGGTAATPSFHLLPLLTCVRLRNHLQTATCEHFYANMTSLLLGSPPLSLHHSLNISSSHSSSNSVSRSVFFSKLVVGVSDFRFFGKNDRRRGSVWNLFKAGVYQRLHLSPEKAAGEGRLVVFRKEGRRNVTNLDEVVEALRGRNLHPLVVTVDRLSLEEQVRAYIGIHVFLTG